MTTGRMPLRTTALLALAVLLAGCNRGFCTAVGCFSGVGVDLTSAAASFGDGAVTARVCVDQACSTQDVVLGPTPPRLQGTVPTTVDGDTATVPVGLRLSRGSTVLVDSTVQAVLTRYAPNGESCGPICYQGQVVLVGGTLRAVRGG